MLTWTWKRGKKRYSLFLYQRRKKYSFDLTSAFVTFNTEGRLEFINKLQNQLLVNLCLRYKYQFEVMEEEKLVAMRNELNLMNQRWPEIYKYSEWGNLMSQYLDFWGFPWNYPKIIQKADAVYKNYLTNK